MSSHTLSKLAHRCAQVLTPLIWGPWRTRAVGFGCQEPHRVPQCAVPVLSFATCARVCLQEGGKNLVSRAPARTRDRLCWNRECPVPQQGALGSPCRGERACPAPAPPPAASRTLPAHSGHTCVMAPGCPSPSAPGVCFPTDIVTAPGPCRRAIYTGPRRHLRNKNNFIKLSKIEISFLKTYPLL